MARTSVVLFTAYATIDALLSFDRPSRGVRAWKEKPVYSARSNCAIARRRPVQYYRRCAACPTVHRCVFFTDHRRHCRRCERRKRRMRLLNRSAYYIYTYICIYCVCVYTAWRGGEENECKSVWTRNKCNGQNTCIGTSRFYYNRPR